MDDAVTIPVTMYWDGTAMQPLNAGWLRRCQAQFNAGEIYTLVEYHERSIQSHRWYFACLKKGFDNLPEELTDQFPNVESLRKFALIKSGYADEKSIVCASKAEAQRVAAFLKPDYGLVIVREATVRVYVAKSQSMRAMGKKEFNESKNAVLAVVAKMIGVDPAVLLAQPIEGETNVFQDHEARGSGSALQGAAPDQEAQARYGEESPSQG